MLKEHTEECRRSPTTVGWSRSEELRRQALIMCFQPQPSHPAQLPVASTFHSPSVFFTPSFTYASWNAWSFTFWNITPTICWKRLTPFTFIWRHKGMLTLEDKVPTSNLCMIISCSHEQWTKERKSSHKKSACESQLLLALLHKIFLIHIWNSFALPYRRSFECCTFFLSTWF